MFHNLWNYATFNQSHCTGISKTSSEVTLSFLVNLRSRSFNTHDTIDQVRLCHVMSRSTLQSALSLFRSRNNQKIATTANTSVIAFLGIPTRKHYERFYKRQLHVGSVLIFVFTRALFLYSSSAQLSIFKRGHNTWSYCNQKGNSHWSFLLINNDSRCNYNQCNLRISTEMKILFLLLVLGLATLIVSVYWWLIIISSQAL